MLTTGQTQGPTGRASPSSHRQAQEACLLGNHWQAHAAQ